MNYWTTSCMTYAIGLITGMFLGVIDNIWVSMIPIFIGSIAVSSYHYFYIEKQDLKPDGLKDKKKNG